MQGPFILCRLLLLLYPDILTTYFIRVYLQIVSQKTYIETKGGHMSTDSLLSCQTTPLITCDTVSHQVQLRSSRTSCHVINESPDPALIINAPNNNSVCVSATSCSAILGATAITLSMTHDQVVTDGHHNQQSL